MWATETKERTEEPETKTIKTFSSIHMFRQQEATYRTELWSVKHSRRYCCMWKAWKIVYIAGVRKRPMLTWNYESTSEEQQKDKKQSFEKDSETGIAIATGRDSVVDMATRYRLDGPRSERRWDHRPLGPPGPFYNARRGPFRG
jgi:hypothetical protein